MNFYPSFVPNDLQAVVVDLETGREITPRTPIEIGFEVNTVCHLTLQAATRRGVAIVYAQDDKIVTWAFLAMAVEKGDSVTIVNPIQWTTS